MSISTAVTPLATFQRAPITVEGTGLLARCLQHETDHLRGGVFLDRLTGDERRSALREVRSADWSH